MKKFFRDNQLLTYDVDAKLDEVLKGGGFNPSLGPILIDSNISGVLYKYL